MDDHLRAATALANFLDGKFKFLGFRFGMNGVLGFIPAVGDFIVAFLSLYLVWIGVRLGLPPSKIGEMLSNVFTNFFIGLIPVVGDFVDFFHKANLKNLKILQEHANKNIIKGEIVE